MAALFLLPLLLLGGLELALRLAGCGYPASFFLKRRVEGQDVLVENKQFGLRFFPPALARSPAATVLPAVKSPGTYRIFLFGESAALGDPRPAYGMGRYLEALLRERYPQAEFEVVCVAMTAINSHGILPIARECARLQGDLWILYLGNNEMMGPFGASTVFGPQTPRLGMVRALQALQTTRTGQSLAAFARRFSGPSAGSNTWSGLRMFLESPVAPDDPHKQIVYDNFRGNLEGILKAGLRSGAQVLLSTVAVNLRDCAPFASLHSRRLKPELEAEWDQLLKVGRLIERNGELTGALKIYDQAAQLDPGFAEVQFRRGRCLLSLTNLSEARKALELARDLDALPFRADSRLNALIAEAAGRFADRGVRFLDAASALAEGATASLPGEEFFWEHVHPTFEGNYRLARMYAAATASLLPTAITHGARPDWASQEQCEQRLGLTDWNRYSATEDMLQRVLDLPFSRQATHAGHLQHLRNRLAELKTRLTAQAAQAAQAIYESALQAAPRDHRRHENFTEFLEAVGRLEEATAQWQKVRDLTPHHHLGYFQLGRLLARQKKWAEAEGWLRQTLAMRPELLDAYLELGPVLAAQNRPEEALGQYAEARRRWPEEPRLCLKIADVLAAQNRRTEATESMREAVRLRPSYWEARYLLGVELAVAENFREAQGQFEEVIRLRPDYVRAHLNLGVTLARQTNLYGAIDQFRETLRLDPSNRLAQVQLERAEAMVRGAVSPNTNAPAAPGSADPPTLPR